MRNIDRNGLDLAFKLETGYYRENVSVRDYIEWLEEKVTNKEKEIEDFAEKAFKAGIKHGIINHTVAVAYEFMKAEDIPTYPFNHWLAQQKSVRE